MLNDGQTVPKRTAKKFNRYMAKKPRKLPVVKSYGDWLARAYRCSGCEQVKAEFVDITTPNCLTYGQDICCVCCKSTGLKHC